MSTCMNDIVIRKQPQVKKSHLVNDLKNLHVLALPCY
ncbi:unnamed protein product [Onchocerca flexuosa]|uniref:Transposase n=1 Tax=Onchocerca flexuosa TaxID=387005 RepID=A0A183H9D7_9BILA|nr:unnamed protein product [Onchocerca flexuosa]